MDWEVALRQIVLQISDPKVARLACEILVAVAKLYTADHPDDLTVIEIVTILRAEIESLDKQIGNGENLTVAPKT